MSQYRLSSNLCGLVTFVKWERKTSLNTASAVTFVVRIWMQILLLWLGLNTASAVTFVVLNFYGLWIIKKCLNTASAVTFVV